MDPEEAGIRPALLLEKDPSTAANAVTETTLRVVMKRTKLNTVHEVNDFRAAISFLQGEPGVDPDRIGIWGSSNGGSVVTAVAAGNFHGLALAADGRVLAWGRNYYGQLGDGTRVTDGCSCRPALADGQEHLADVVARLHDPVCLSGL